MASSRDPEAYDEPKYEIGSICIFLVSGKTFTFKSIGDFITNESMITFSYSAMSDRKRKYAYFSRQNVAGYSTCS